MKHEEISGTTITETEFRELERGRQVILRQGHGDHRLEAIVVVQDNFKTHILAIVEKVLVSGGGFDPPIVRTSRVIGNIGEIFSISSATGKGSKKT